MQITQEAFIGDNDLREMEVLAHNNPAENLHVTDLPYRLSSWALEDLGNIQLWKDENKHLLAWIVMQAPFDTLDFCCTHAMESILLPDLLKWADVRSIEHPELIPLGSPENKPCWFINVFSDQAERIRIIEDAGFVCQANVGEYSWSKFLLHRPGNLPVKEYFIPEGFEIRSLLGECEVKEYVRLHQETFRSKIMSVDWRKRTFQHPDHVTDLDLVIVAPDNRLAAFCVCWLDQHGLKPVGQIEPLGCHPDFRHFALGRAVLVEGIRRLQSYNVVEIIVETDNWRNTALRLYESLGFQVKQDILVFRKDY